MGDAVGNKNITIIHCQEHFSTLLNSVHNTDSKEFVSDQIERELFSVQKTTVSASDVLDSLKAVKLGKAADIDGLSAETLCVLIPRSVSICHYYLLLHVC